MRIWVASGWLLLVLACSSVTPPPSQPAAPPPSTAGAETSRTEPPLFLALSKLAAPPAIVDALPTDIKRVLDGHVDALTAEQRQLLLAGTDPVVATRPMLYAAAGGLDPSILSLVYSSTAASNELVMLAMNAEGEHDLAAASNALAERAARWVLHARAADLSADVEHRREHLQDVAFAAGVLQADELERLALLELEELYPDPAWTVALVRLDLRDLAVADARARLGASQLPSDVRDALQPQIDVAAAVAAATEPPASVDQAVALARQMMSLGLVERAEHLLRPHASSAGGHLGLATALARAVTRASACPNVVGAAASNEYICQQVWSRELVKDELSILVAAWKSGQGRDPEAIETYVGLSYVVPLMYGLSALGQQATPESVRASFEAIGQVAEEAAASDGYFRGVALMADALGVAMEAASGAASGRAAIEPEVRQQLLARASELAQELGSEPWGQAAVLGVAAMVSREEKTAKLLAPLRAGIAPEHEITLGTLLLWELLADGDDAQYQQLHSWFGEVATNPQAGSFERSKWLLLWAEAGAHLEPSTVTYSTLQKMAENLSDERVPLGLRLRARLDRAGLLARAGDFAAAAEVLAPIVRDTRRGAVASHDEQELLVAATGYMFVLRALSTDGVVRQKHAAELEKLLLDVGRSNAAPPTLQMWLMMWRAEFDYRKQHAACAGDVQCAASATKARGMDAGKLARAVGERSAQLLKNGVLPVGGVQLEFRYLGRGQLAPRLVVAPRFLMAHVPPS